MYMKESTGLQKVTYTAGMQVPDNAVWLDMYNLSPEEEACAESFLNLDIPTREEMHELELSSSLYQENNAIYMKATILTKADTAEPESHAVTFIIVGQRLITIRYSEPKPFIHFAARALKLPPDLCTAQHIYVGLVESVIERIADILESTGKSIDQMTRMIFRASKSIDTKPDYQRTLLQIGHEGDIISKCRESMMTLNRMCSYAVHTSLAGMEGENYVRLETIIKDIAALNDHAAFLSNKINFLLDATLGMINNEQNTIIKIFSVVAVVFLPPTLIASIYGMNFKIIPELQWEFGYPMAIGMMVLSAILPYLYFKHRKWL
jgi:magnesium transporter